MSLLERIEQIDGTHYVLPKGGNMRRDVHAFSSEPLFATTDDAHSGGAS